MTTPFTEGCPGANNKASPPGRHQEQAPKQRCTFRPTTFSSVQFSSATGAPSQTSTMPCHTPQCLPSGTVPIRSWTRTLRRPGICHRHLPYHTIYHAIPCHTIPWVCYRRRNQWLRLALALFGFPLIWLARVVYLTYVEATYHTIGVLPSTQPVATLGSSYHTMHAIMIHLWRLASHQRPRLAVQTVSPVYF